MDGQLARVMGRDSQFGLQFDSIVDACTFGIVPAAIIYQAHLPTGWGLALAFAYLLCGALRLARFNALNLEGERGEFYMGLAIPTAAVCLTQYVVFVKAWPIPHATPLAVLLILVLSFLMVSRLDYDSVPNFRGTSLRRPLQTALLCHHSRADHLRQQLFLSHDPRVRLLRALSLGLPSFAR